MANIDFNADRLMIRPGETATLRWAVEGVKEVYLYAEGEDWRDHGVVGAGERQVQPGGTTNYVLRVVQTDDRVVLRGLEVLVQAEARAAAAPSGDVFTVDRAVVQPGECVTFRWRIEGIKAIYFYREGQSWQDHGVAGVAEHPACPKGTTTYLLRIVKPDDTVEFRALTVQVQEPAPPAGDLFTVDRTVVRPGECVTFRWRIEGIKAIYFYREGQSWQDHGVAGVAEHPACPKGTTTYLLRIVKPDDTVDVRALTVQVR